MRIGREKKSKPPIYSWFHEFQFHYLPAYGLQMGMLFQIFINCLLGNFVSLAVCLLFFQWTLSIIHFLNYNLIFEFAVFFCGFSMIKSTMLFYNWIFIICHWKSNISIGSILCDVRIPLYSLLVVLLHLIWKLRFRYIVITINFNEIRKILNFFI